MNYHEARNYIDRLSGRGIKPGLDTIQALCRQLGNPQNSFNAIHIAGTNGKGSTGAFLEGILLSANKSVCRFISPAVGDYLEKFTCNGTPVSEELYCKCVEAVITAVQELEHRGIYPSSFEAETAVAFLIFKAISPDFAIIECGMGGALDSTNIIPAPKLSVITSISLDHISFLGDTSEKIAIQKCGIIKENGQVVTLSSHSPAVKTVINSVCTSKNATVHYAGEPLEVVYSDKKTSFSFFGERYEISLLGTYQPHNAVLAIKSAQLLGIDTDIIKKGLAGAVWGYRFERIGKYILDGAHNAAAAYELASTIEKTLQNKRIAFICGCFSDKDYNTLASVTAPYADTVFCITPPSERGLDKSVLCDAFKKAGAIAHTAATLSEAINLTSDFDTVIIFGSLSILGDAKKLTEGIYNNAKMQ